MATFGMLQGRRSYLIYGNLIPIVGSVISASSYGLGQMIAWRVLVGLGNVIMTSMGPVCTPMSFIKDLNSVSFSPANSERPYVMAPPKHHPWDAGISIAGSATDRGILLVYAPIGRKSTTWSQRHLQ